VADGYANGNDDPWGDAFYSVADVLGACPMGDGEIDYEKYDQGVIDNWMKYEEELNALERENKRFALSVYRAEQQRLATELYKRWELEMEQRVISISTPNIDRILRGRDDLRRAQQFGYR
jgi:hypothetical protein